MPQNAHKPDLLAEIVRNAIRASHGYAGSAKEEVMIRVEKLSSALAWISIAVFSCLSQAAADESLLQPTGQIILTISGDITNTNNGDKAEFDLDMSPEIVSII